MNLHEVYLAAQLAAKGVDLSNFYSKSETDQRIIAKVAEIIANAPEDFDTLKEMSDWINEHEDSAAAMNSAIAANTTAIAGKVDKVSGKGLSTNDFTDADKSKLDDLENYDDAGIKADIAGVSRQANTNRLTLGYQNKNLLMNNCIVKVINGVTATPNEDGSITLSGSNTAGDFILYWNMQTGTSALTATSQYVDNKKFIPSGKYILSGGATGASIQVRSSENNTADKSVAYTSGSNESMFSITDDNKYVWCRVLIASGANFSTPVTIYPMIRLAEITDNTYEPYKPSVEERLNNITDQIFGLGTKIPDGADLNDYTQPGIYYVYDSTHSKTILNNPQNTAGFRLEVVRIQGDASCMQTLYPNLTAHGAFYKRTANSSGIGPWFKHQGVAVTT